MSTEYGTPKLVPTETIALRLMALSEAIIAGDRTSEFTMRIPAEYDRDADIVMCEAANRLRTLHATKLDLDLANARIKELDAINLSLSNQRDKFKHVSEGLAEELVELKRAEEK